MRIRNILTDKELKELNEIDLECIDDSDVQKLVKDLTNLKNIDDKCIVELEKQVKLRGTPITIEDERKYRFYLGRADALNYVLSRLDELFANELNSTPPSYEHYMIMENGYDR